MTPSSSEKTYVNVTPTIRVEIDNDPQIGIITYRLQSKVFGQWYYKNEVTEYYDVPAEKTT